MYRCPHRHEILPKMEVGFYGPDDVARVAELPDTRWTGAEEKKSQVQFFSMNK